MNKNQLTIGRWTLATFLGWLLGVIVILVFSSLLDAAGIEHLQFYVGLGMGAGVGFSQWLFLRKRFLITQKWFWFSATGMDLPFAVLDFFLPGNVTYKLPISVAPGGIATGILQTSLLKKCFSIGVQWVISSFAGWVFAALTVLLIDYTMILRSASNALLLALLNLILILAGRTILGWMNGRSLKRLQFFN